MGIKQLSINNYYNLKTQDIGFSSKKSNINKQKQENYPDNPNNHIIPLKNYSLKHHKVYFGNGTSVCENLIERATRLLIRNVKYPLECKSDIVWALGLDKIIQEKTNQLKNNKISHFQELITGLAEDYKSLKQRRETELQAEWYQNLSPRDKKIADYVYSIKFDRNNIDLNEVKKILNADSSDGKANEIFSSYNPKNLEYSDIVGAVVNHRYERGIEPYGVEGFGQERPIGDPYNCGTIVTKNIHEEKLGYNFAGRRYAHYCKMYEKPELLARFKGPEIIPIEQLEAIDSSLVSIIEKHKLPKTKGLQLLVYRQDKPSELGKFPMTSTTVVFYKELGKEPELTSVIWKMPEAEDFPVIKEHLDKLFGEYLKHKDLPNSPEKKQKILDLAAEIQWYFHQMMPYRRGSAAMGDALARTLMESAGLKLSRLKANVMPDFETFINDLGTFKHNYPELFEEPPTFFKNHKE